MYMFTLASIPKTRIYTYTYIHTYIYIYIYIERERERERERFIGTYTRDKWDNIYTKKGGWRLREREREIHWSIY